MDCCLKIHVHWFLPSMLWILWKWFLKTLVWLSLIIFSTQPFVCELSLVYLCVTWCHSEQFGFVWLTYIHKGSFQNACHSEINYLVSVTPNWIMYVALHFHFLPNNKMLWRKMTVMWRDLRFLQQCLARDVTLCWVSGFWCFKHEQTTLFLPCFRDSVELVIKYFKFLSKNFASVLNNSFFALAKL